MSSKRDFITINMRLYFDEDPDLIEYLDGKPKTWLIKEALRQYRDSVAKPIQAPADTGAADVFKDF